jgi:putative ABC transport system permease protein
MSAQFAKVWFDLWSNRSRTLQVVLVIALGAIGIGLVVGGRNLIAGTIADQWRAAEPPNIKLAVNPPLNNDQLKTISRINGVDQVEGLQNTTVEWRYPGDIEWQTALLESRDFTQQKMELIDLTSGNWPDRNALAVIKTADTLYGVGEGARIEVRANDQIRELPINGTLKPRGPFPVVFIGQPIFYADPATFARLTGQSSYNTLLTREMQFNQSQAELTDLAIQDYFEDIGVDSVGTLFPSQARILSPDIPPAADLLNAIFLILGLIGAIIILLGIFLVYTSVNAIITQQVSQIGVMKAIGASSGQLFKSYFILVSAFGVLAAFVAVPLGSLGARGLQSLFINLLNLQDPGFSFDPEAVIVQVAVSLSVPFLAATLPLLAGVRITVREAVNTYGLTGSSGLIERMIARVQHIPYTLLLVLSNTFRNRGRVFIIQITLVLAGIVFMMVIGVNDATRYTFGGKLTSIHTYQVNVQFEGFERSQRIEGLASAYGAVSAVDSWLVASGKVRPASQTDAEVTDARVRIFGLPPTSEMYTPEVSAGRWLNESDGRAVVITERLANDGSWAVGDRITLAETGGGESEWLVVGITYDPLANAALFVPRTVLQRELGQVGRVNTLWINTTGDEAAQLDQTVLALLGAFETRGFDLAATGTFGYSTIVETVEESVGGFSIIVQLLAIMAVIIAVVGGVGLSGVLNLNVLERRREIGVMRSIGASSWRVIRISVGEGLLLGWMSWLIALPLSIPAAYALSTKGLSVALNQQLAYQFNPTGALIWLTIISVLAILSSLFPARNAARVSVRASLSY